MPKLFLIWASIVLLLFSFSASSQENRKFRFAILGDRTGEAVSGVYEEAWREIKDDRPDFVINVGDTIQGGDDHTVNQEWEEVFRDIGQGRRSRLFLVPGNHDAWSPVSARAFEKYAKHPLHYSFDYQQAHFTVLDNSRSDELSSAEIAFLRNDLAAHQKQSLKFVFMHRPSWILQVLLQNPQFPLHQAAKQFGVQYVIAGHIHQMLAFELDGVHYVSMASSGGHLRDTKQYQKGWFFQHTLVTIDRQDVAFAIKELAPPFGKARKSSLSDWASAGLRSQDSRSQ